MVINEYVCAEVHIFGPIFKMKDEIFRNVRRAVNNDKSSQDDTCFHVLNISANLLLNPSNRAKIHFIRFITFRLLL